MVLAAGFDPFMGIEMWDKELHFAAPSIPGGEEKGGEDTP
jgi:hypothetical protein